MGLRLELFVNSVAESKDFYQDILGFDVISYEPEGYTVLRRDDIQISLERVAHLSADHPLKPLAGEGVGRGIEIVLEVADLEAAYLQARDSGWTLASPLQAQPWGLHDFRLIDPDGFYLRITSPA
jgi:catechol 2,3-dioxygenase-like lactoylglutathione lyase family enzyme